MITYKQITKSSEIASISDYYVVDVRTTGQNSAVNAISSVSMIQVSDNEITQEAAIRIAPDSDTESSAENGYYHAEQVADSMARLLIEQTVIAEPTALKFLRVLLERHGHEGNIRFVPINKLVSNVFPDIPEDSIQEMARLLEIPERENAGLLRTAYFENELFKKCRIALGAKLPADLTSESSTEKARHSAEKKKRISSRTLRHWAESLWSMSPWVVIGTVFLLVLVFIIQLPRKENTEIDRNTAPINYLVLSWDQNGKYGTKPKSFGDPDSPIQFRVPYGVYNVLNNNSIPVELTVITEDHPQSNAAALPDGGTSDTMQATGLRAEKSAQGTSDSDDEEESGITKVTMRPNSTRQIVIDTDQYLTLSEDAKDIILFYQSAVPEERESDTTGRDNGDGGKIVYAYIKGTEVRFRKSPSLEGAIIDILQNGQQVQVLGVTGEWTHVSVQKDKGYVFSQYITSEDPQAAAYEAKLAEAKAAEKSRVSPDETPDPGTEAAADVETDDISPEVQSDIQPAQ